MWNQELHTVQAICKKKEKKKKSLSLSSCDTACPPIHGFLLSGHNLSCTQLSEAALLFGSLVSWNFTHS
jgi:hypothetical protein